MNTAQPRDNEGPLFIGDDLALDFINTQYGMGEAQRECLDSDTAVRGWLRQAGLSPDAPAGKAGALLDAALNLRSGARAMVQQRKAGVRADPAAVNAILKLGMRYSELRWLKGEAPDLLSHPLVTHPLAPLVPVAEAIARLLVEGDFDKVRTCESSDCTLWFYDRTKSHHRRWCSMASCGNRHKVAEFRARRRST